LLTLFTTSAVDTGGKFAAGVVDTGGNLPPALLTPVANLPPVSLKPVANLPPVSTTQVKLVEKFAAGVVDSGGAPWLANISANFRKNLKRAKWILWGWGETDSSKQPEAKNLVTLSL
jgi:hypothetical protein